MFLATRLFLLISILTISCAFNLRNDRPIVAQGNVIYSFEAGKMQCQSEVDPAGHIFVLLKSLDKNTTVKFNGLATTKNARSKKLVFIVKTIMEVVKDTDLCGLWIDRQEVIIEIDPLPTETIHLKGKQVYNSDQMTIMLSNISD